MASPSSSWTPERLQCFAEQRRELLTELAAKNRGLQPQLQQRRQSDPSPLPREITDLLQQLEQVLENIQSTDRQLVELAGRYREELLPELEKAQEFGQLLHRYHSPEPAPGKPRFFRVKI